MHALHHIEVESLFFGFTPISARGHSDARTGVSAALPGCLPETVLSQPWLHVQHVASWTFPSPSEVGCLTAKAVRMLVATVSSGTFSWLLHIQPHLDDGA